MTNKKDNQKLKPYNAKIQVCRHCGKIDVSKGHEKDCNPEYEEYLRESRGDYR